MKRFFFLWLALTMLSAPETAAQYVILRKPVLYAAPNCFEFYLTDIQSINGRNLIGTDPSTGMLVLTDYALRQGWGFDPNAGGPYQNREAADYVMTVLARFGGDWYECFGPRTMTLPDWIPLPNQPPPPPMTADEGYCILRKPDWQQPIPDGPPVCFEFYLSDTRRSNAGRMADIDAFGCRVTDYAARQGWEVDPVFGGPYPREAQQTASANMSRLSRYGGDLYGCLSETVVDPVLPPPPLEPDALGREWQVQETREGVFTRRGDSNTWDCRFNSGTVSVATITLIGANQVRIERHDVSGNYPGAWATYTGTLNGRSLEGTAVWHWNNTTYPPGRWTATIVR